MKRITRDERVLKYMKTHKSINFWDATIHCGTSRLAANIWNLKNKNGCTIEKEMLNHSNQFGDVSKVAHYKLIA